MTVHNFKFDLEKEHIPLFLGKGGKNFFTKVVIGSIKAFKSLEDTTHQETIDMVKNGDLVIKNLRIDIKTVEDTEEPDEGRDNQENERVDEVTEPALGFQHF